MAFHSGTAPPPVMKPSVPSADKKTKYVKTEITKARTNDFEAYARQTENGVEFWLARDLQRLLKNFKTVIDKARTACEIVENCVPHDFRFLSSGRYLSCYTSKANKHWQNHSGTIAKT